VRSWLGFVVIALVGCSGGGDEEECENLEFLVSVTGPEGETVTDASVEIDNTACTANGDGTYLCTAAAGADEYHIAAVHPNYNATAQTVPAPEGCDQVPVALALGVMMGA